ncbi:MAG: hypothetical protein AAFN13_02460 [Bacteroidota bacterium]
MSTSENRQRLAETLSMEIDGLEQSLIDEGVFDQFEAEALDKEIERIYYMSDEELDAAQLARKARELPLEPVVNEVTAITGAQSHEARARAADRKPKRAQRRRLGQWVGIGLTVVLAAVVSVLVATGGADSSTRVLSLQPVAEEVAAARQHVQALGTAESAAQFEEALRLLDEAPPGAIAARLGAEADRVKVEGATARLERTYADLQNLMFSVSRSDDAQRRDDALGVTALLLAKAALAIDDPRQARIWLEAARAYGDEATVREAERLGAKPSE